MEPPLSRIVLFCFAIQCCTVQSLYCSPPLAQAQALVKRDVELFLPTLVKRDVELFLPTLVKRDVELFLPTLVKRDVELFLPTLVKRDVELFLPTCCTPRVL